MATPALKTQAQVDQDAANAQAMAAQNAQLASPEELQNQIDASLQQDFTNQRNTVADLNNQRMAQLSQPQQVDLSPIAGLIDQWTGSQLLRSYKAPDTPAERAQIAAKLQDQIMIAQQGLSKEQRQYLKDQLENKVAQAAGAEKAQWQQKNYDMEQQKLDATNALRKQQMESDANYKNALLGLKKSDLGLRRDALETKKNAVKEKPATGEQIKLASFATRTDKSHNDALAIENDPNFDVSGLRAGIQNSSLFPEALKEDKIKRLQSAQRDFVNAVLRWESGAAISIPEFDSSGKNYFAQVGDPPDVIAQKQARRQDIIDILKEGGGKVLGHMQHAAPSSAADDGLDSMSDEELQALGGQ